MTQLSELRLINDSNILYLKKINRSYKDMLLKNYNKYIDVLLFSISLSGLLSFFVEHVTISNNNPFIFTVISLVGELELFLYTFKKC